MAFNLGDLTLVKAIHEIWQEKFKGQLAPLQHEIDNPHLEGDQLGNYLIKTLVKNPKGVRLTFGHLKRLDAWLRTCGSFVLSNEPLFREDRNVIDILRISAKRGILQLIGARASEGSSTGLRLWDVLALGEIAEQVPVQKGKRSLPFVHCSVSEDVPKSFKGQPWNQYIENVKQPVIAFGSPRASPATEVLLAKMWNINPFQEPVAHANIPMPFQFAFQGQNSMPYPSSFGVPAGHRIRSARNANTLKAGDDIYHTPFGYRKSARHYGVVAVQRCSLGCIRIVLAGLSGPGTLLAAKMLRSLEYDPEKMGSHHVLWGVASTEVDPKAASWETSESIVAPQKWDVPPHYWSRDG